MPATTEAVELAQLAALAASDKQARDVIAFDVSERLAIADAFLLCSATNDRQVGAIVREIQDRLAAAGHKPSRREGDRENRWVLMDYGDLVVHVQHVEERTFYALERLWRDCPEIKLPEAVTVGGGPRDLAADMPGDLSRGLSDAEGPRPTGTDA
ncbi:ribosome silencing factor [Actinopolymorpha sp. NPDC004070]|uniref:ribosome silencing factor n=1 Tax=Actinopolymorpha sp. NPDC004070 TaxID=3154548 RepID=UPI0033A55C69